MAGKGKEAIKLYHITLQYMVDTVYSGDPVSGALS